MARRYRYWKPTGNKVTLPTRSMDELSRYFMRQWKTLNTLHYAYLRSTGTGLIIPATISFFPACSSGRGKEREVHRISDGLHTRIIRMQMVAAIKSGQIPIGMGRIVSGSILVDDRIASASFASKKDVDLLARSFFGWSPIVSSLIRCQRRTNKLDMMLVRFANQLLKACN